MKIFTTRQIKEIDDYTIINEPVSSADLMERAADQLLRWYVRSFDRSRRVIIFVGPGNNGGDGLALARLLSVNRFNTEVFFLKDQGIHRLTGNIIFNGWRKKQKFFSTPSKVLNISR